MNIARSVMYAAAVAAPILYPLASPAAVDAAQHESHATSVSSALIATVRRATAPFRDVRNVPEGYEPALGCVSGPQEGAMGVHYLKGPLVEDDRLYADEPEALIYEFKRGGARLVGVEYIVLASVWHETHAVNDPPVLEGHLLHFNESPNRFGLPPFYELHVWAWRDNPNGAFADWNTRVSCEGQ